MIDAERKTGTVIIVPGTKSDAREGRGISTEQVRTDADC